MKKFGSLLLIVFALFSSCKKDENTTSDPTPTTAPAVSIQMDHLAGNQKLFLDSTYTNPNGDLFTPTLFKYYVSNIRFIKQDNTVDSVPNSYFLVNQDISSSMILEMTDLKAGQYKAVRFLIGVDSAANTAGPGSGALDAVNGMYWPWLGYINLKMEGTSPVVAGDNFYFHIGGYYGPANTIREVELDFDGDILTLASGKNPVLHLTLDVMELFANPVLINLATTHDIQTPGTNAAMIATNYADMFAYSHIHE